MAAGDAERFAKATKAGLDIAKLTEKSLKSVEKSEREILALQGSLKSQIELSNREFKDQVKEIEKVADEMEKAGASRKGIDIVIGPALAKLKELQKARIAALEKSARDEVRNFTATQQEKEAIEIKSEARRLLGLADTKEQKNAIIKTAKAKMAALNKSARDEIRNFTATQKEKEVLEIASEARRLARFAKTEKQKEDIFRAAQEKIAEVLTAGAKEEAATAVAPQFVGLKEQFKRVQTAGVAESEKDQAKKVNEDQLRAMRESVTELQTQTEIWQEIAPFLRGIGRTIGTVGI